MGRTASILIFAHPDLFLIDGKDSVQVYTYEVRTPRQWVTVADCIATEGLRCYQTGTSSLIDTSARRGFKGLDDTGLNDIMRADKWVPDNGVASF